MLKQILVTGVSSGLGSEILKCQHPEFKVLGISRYSDPSNSSVFSYEEIESIPSQPQVLILNAGIGEKSEGFSKLMTSGFQEILEVNLIKPLELFSRLHDSGKLCNLKHLILVGSRFSSLDFINRSTFEDLPGYGYCLSKTALASFVQIIRKEHPSFTVNIIHPGVMNTDMGSEMGYPPSLVANTLLEKIKNGVFESSMDGIYDLNEDQIIPF